MAVTPYRALSYLGLGKQSVQGAGVSPTKFPILRRQAFIPAQNVAEYRTGNVRDISFAVKQDFRYGGSFQTFLYADEGAAIMAWAMGADTKTGSSDPYTHTLALADTLPYLSAEAAFYENQIIDRVVDTKIAKLLIEAEARREVMLTVDLLGSSVAVQGSPTAPSFNNGAGEGPMTFAQGAFTLSGPTDAATLQAQIQKLGIELDQDMSAEYGPGSVGPIALMEQGRKVTIKLTALFTSDDLHRLVHYGSSSGTAVSATVGTGSIAAAFTSVAASPGPERSCTLTSAQFFWTLSKPMFDPDGKVGTIEAEATAYRSGSTMPLSAVFKNGVSTAYI
jgi:hypothetical protein